MGSVPLLSSDGRIVQILRGKQQIADAFGVSTQTVKRWHREGAPIVLSGTYRAEAWELWCWYRQQKKPR